MSVDLWKPFAGFFDQLATASDTERPNIHQQIRTEVSKYLTNQNSWTALKGFEFPAAPTDPQQQVVYNILQRIKAQPKLPGKSDETDDSDNTLGTQEFLQDLQTRVGQDLPEKPKGSSGEPKPPVEGEVPVWYHQFRILHSKLIESSLTEQDRQTFSEIWVQILSDADKQKFLADDLKLQGFPENSYKQKLQQILNIFAEIQQKIEASAASLNSESASGILQNVLNLVQEGDGSGDGEIPVEENSGPETDEKHISLSSDPGSSIPSAAVAKKKKKPENPIPTGLAQDRPLDDPHWTLVCLLARGLDLDMAMMFSPGFVIETIQEYFPNVDENRLSYLLTFGAQELMHNDLIADKGESLGKDDLVVETAQDWKYKSEKIVNWAKDKIAKNDNLGTLVLDLWNEIVKANLGHLKKKKGGAGGSGGGAEAAGGGAAAESGGAEEAEESAAAGSGGSAAV